MDVQVREQSATLRTLEFRLEPEEVRRHLDRVAGEYQRRTALPGFRRGRVPRSVLEARFGGSIQEEALESAVSEAYQRAVREHDLDPLVPPRVEDLEYKQGEALRFQVRIEVRPKLEPRDYREIPLVRRVREIPESEVDQTLERIRQETAIVRDLERPAEAADVVVVDHVRVDEKGRTLKSSRVRNATLELGHEGLLPAFRDGLIGASAGESRTIDVKYPEDFGNPELAGRKARFHVKVKKVQEKKIRELDDNLAKEVFGLETLDELRSRIRLQLEGEERMRSRQELEERLVDELLRRNPVPVPESLAERLTEDALRRMAQSGTEAPAQDEMRLAYRQAVERRIAREWLLEAIGRQEEIRVENEELAEEMKRLAQSRGGAGRDFRGLPTAQRRERVHDALHERKVFDFLIEASKVEEETVKEDRQPVSA